MHRSLALRGVITSCRGLRTSTAAEMPIKVSLYARLYVRDFNIHSDDHTCVYFWQNPLTVFYFAYLRT